MTVTAIGVVLSADGLASRRELGADWRSRTVAWATPALELRDRHPNPLPVSVEHEGAPIGRIVGIHRAPGWGGVVAWAVAELDAPGADNLLSFPDPIYFSAECDAAVRSGTAVGHDIRLLGCALTTKTARLLGEPVLLKPGTLRDRDRWQLDGPAKTAVDETATQLRHQGDGQVLTVTGWRPLTDNDRAGLYARGGLEQPDLAWRAPGQIEHSRHHGRILDVR